MCAPKVMEYVNKKFSRRDLFKLGTTGLAATSLTTLSRTQAQDNMLSYSKLIDLTHTLHADFPMFPGAPAPKFNTLVTVKDNGYYGLVWELWEHSGTHMDAPAHFVDGGLTADILPLEMLIAPIAVIDIQNKAANDPDTMVTIDDITAWEAAHGPLPDGVMVMMNSGWDQRVNQPESFINATDGTMHFPAFSPEAAEFLVNERNITGIAVDTLSLDAGKATSFDVHVTILGAGKFGLENVANLGQLPASGAHLIVGNLKIKHASGGPVRLLAAI